MDLDFGWENTEQAAYSVIASVVAAFLYLMFVSVQGIAEPVQVFYAIGVLVIGLVLSGLEGVSGVWALVSGTIVGVIMIVQSVAVAGGMSVTPRLFLMLLANLPLAIILYFAGYVSTALLSEVFE